MVNKVSLDMNYAQFLGECMVQDANMSGYIQEAILLAERKRTPENMQVVYESVGEKLKEGLNKMMDFFRRLWAKFTETISNVFNTNAGYLEKYKNIILRQPARDVEWSMYNWNQKAILAAKIPEFNLQAQKENLVDIDTFSRNVLQQTVPIFKDNKNGGTIQEMCTRFFRGGSDEKSDIKEGTLNIADMYNYCIKYNQISGIFKKDINIIETAARECQQEIGKIKDSPKEEGSVNITHPTQDQLNKEKEVDKTTTTTASETQESAIMADNNVFYSFITEGYVYEATESGGTDASKGGTTADKTSKPAVQSTMKSVDVAKDNAANKDNINKDVDSNMNQDTAKDMYNRIENFIKATTSVSSAKMVCAQAMYKDYMDIMTAKVRFYTGKKDTDQVASTNTNSNNSDEKGKITA